MRDWPTAKSQMSIISCTSPSPSAMIFPVSSVTSWPSSCFNSRNALPRRRTVSPRTGPGVTRHFRNASCAREIALLQSSAEAVRMLASRRPSMGEIFSIVAPPPRHSPSNTPALSSVRPSFSRGVFIDALTAVRQSGEPPNHHDSFRAPAYPAELPHQLYRFIDNFRSDIERRTKTDRVLAGAKRQKTKVEKAGPKFFARFGIGKIEREKYSAAARGGNQRLFRLQIAQLIQEIGTYFRSVLNQTFPFDNAQIMGRAHHIGEVSAPR